MEKKNFNFLLNWAPFNGVNCQKVKALWPLVLNMDIRFIYFHFLIMKTTKKLNFHSSEFLLTHLFMNESKVIITGVAHVIQKFIFGVFGWCI